ncbi:MAG: DUF58 domain-containing protein [Planctomycetes bacterium]|nr:DUF58 domain-containing protein [Planctomycetota bacterium]
MQLVVSRRFTNRSRGEHLARGGGSSNEFRDYRDYSAGDDMRFVDWNIFARLQRPFVKLFHQEEQLHVVLLIDASSSMGFEEKDRRALELAAALGTMALRGGERVSVHVFHSAGRGASRLEPIRGRGKRRELFAFLENVTPGGETTVEQGVEALLRRHRGRGAMFVLSDFLTTGDLNRAFNMAFSAGLVPYGLQLLGPSELSPELSADVRLVDCENAETLDVTGTGELVRLYREHLQALLGHLDAFCRNRGGQFVSLDTALTAETVLTDVLRRRGWVR